MSKKVTCRDFKRYPGSVFVTPTSIPDTAKVQMKAKDWTGVAKDIVADTPLSPPEPIHTREHQSRLTPDTIYAIIEQMDHRWLTVAEVLTVATQFKVSEVSHHDDSDRTTSRQADTKELKKVLHGLFMRGNLAHKQVGPQEWYRYLAVNWRLKNAIVVNMEKLQCRNDWNTADNIKDKMYDKYNLLTVEYVQAALDTLAESNPQMLAETIDGKQHYHWKVKSAPAPEKPKVNRLLSQVDALLGVRS